MSTKPAFNNIAMFLSYRKRKNIQSSIKDVMGGNSRVVFATRLAEKKIYIFKCNPKYLKHNWILERKLRHFN